MVPATIAKMVWSRPMPTPVPGVPLGAALAQDDVAGNGLLATEQLDAETAASGVAAVAG